MGDWTSRHQSLRCAILLADYSGRTWQVLPGDADRERLGLVLSPDEVHELRAAAGNTPLPIKTLDALAAVKSVLGGEVIAARSLA